MNLFAWIGRYGIGTTLYIIDLTFFLAQAIAVWKPHRNFFNRAVYIIMLNQLVLIGVNAIAIISLLALFTGIGVTSQLIYIIHSLTGNNDLLVILARLVLSEMGPLITGFILVGRSCSAIVVDLGNARISGEMEPLEYMGIDLNDYYVAPRLLGMIISQVVLAFYFTAIMILSSVFFSSFLYDFSAQESLANLLGMITFDGVLRFILKNIFFGLIIGIIACFHGFLSGKSSILVSEHLQKAVVRSLIFLFMADGYFIVFTL